MTRRFGLALMIAATGVFAVAFVKTMALPNGVYSCSGGGCLTGDTLWPLLMIAAPFAAIAGWLAHHFGGQGYGRTSGPASFAEVDAGEWAPRQRTESHDVQGRRWTQTWRNTYVGVGAFELALAALFGVAIVVNHSKWGQFLPTIVILSAIGSVFLWIGWRTAQKDRLHTTGLEGSATIVGVKQTGMQMNDNQYVQLDLVVHVPGHPDYEVKHNEIVPEVALGRLTNGEDLPVRVDPNRPSHLIVQWERL